MLSRRPWISVKCFNINWFYNHLHHEWMFFLHSKQPYCKNRFSALKLFFIFNIFLENTFSLWPINSFQVRNEFYMRHLCTVEFVMTIAIIVMICILCNLLFVYLRHNWYFYSFQLLTIKTWNIHPWCDSRQ